MTQEPVATLPEEARPALPGAEIATDVGYITEVYKDVRGIEIQFDQVTYRRCACPGGADVTNENQRVRMLLLGTKPTITLVGTWWSQLTPVRDAHILVALSRTPSGEVTSLAAQAP